MNLNNTSPIIWHKTLDQRMNTFPKHQQILMVCNELNRGENNMKYPEEYHRCMERALELIDLLSGDPRWISGLKELRRGRREIARHYVNPVPQSTRQLQRVLIQLDKNAWEMIGK